MIDRLEKEDFFDVYTYNLVPGIFGNNYQFVEDLIKNQFKPECKRDCILIMGDRIEMFATAVAAFHNNIPIIHYGSGITNTLATFDDYNRHCISLYADVCLCENEQSAEKVLKLKNEIKEVWIPPSHLETHGVLERCYMNNIFIVGNLYLESLNEINESLVPSEPYDLVLINPETLDKESELTPINIERKMILIGPNPDEGSTSLIDFRFPRGNLKTFSGGAFQEIYENLPRPQFLGLLKNCTRFITNSSSAYYEAPHFLKPEQIIQVGERNKNRSTPRTWNQDYKTSEKIVQIIKKWWNEKNEQ